MEEQRAPPVLKTFGSAEEGLGIEVIDCPIDEEHKCLVSVNIQDADTGQFDRTNLCRCHARELAERLDQAVCYAEQVDEGLI